MQGARVWWLRLWTSGGPGLDVGEVDDGFGGGQVAGSLGLTGVFCCAHVVS